MSIHIQRLGHSCFLIESIKGVKILVDPYLTGNKAAAVTADSITNVDIVAVSHGAFDHLGDAVPIVKQTKAKLFCGPDVLHYALMEGVDKEQIYPMIWGTSRTYKGIEIRSIEAKHISLVQCGNQKISGIPMGFIFRMEDGTGLYFSGDTSIFSDLKLFGELYPVKVGMICMDGLPGHAYGMMADEAVLAAKWLGIKLAIPMHYPEESVEPAKFRDILANADPVIDVAILKPGEEYVLPCGKVG